MSCGHVEVRGSWVVGSLASQTACCGPDSGTLTVPLTLSCQNQNYEQVVSTNESFYFASPVLFKSFGILGQLGQIWLLSIQTNAPLTMRVNPLAAILAGVGGVFPTLFAGGETLTFSVDGTAPLTVTFEGADQSAQQVATRINSAWVLANRAGLPASFVGLSAVVLTSSTSGPESTVVVTGGSAQARLGFGAPHDSASGSANDVEIAGTFVCEFNRTSAPVSVQFRGVASSVSVLAAGASA